jgi:hypothetical protein
LRGLLRESLIKCRLANLQPRCGLAWRLLLRCSLKDAIDARTPDLELAGNLSRPHAAFEQRQDFIGLGASPRSTAFVFARSLGLGDTGALARPLASAPR